MATLNTDALNRQGRVYFAANQSGATVTLVNTNTQTGFCLWNPPGSNRKMSIIDMQFQFTTVPSATSVVWACLSPSPSSFVFTGTTALTVYNADGSGASAGQVGKAFSAATVTGQPFIYARMLGYAPTTPATTGALCVKDAVEGALVLVPGSFMVVSYIGQAPVGMAAATWTEYPA